MLTFQAVHSIVLPRNAKARLAMIGSTALFLIDTDCTYPLDQSPFQQHRKAILVQDPIFYASEHPSIDIERPSLL